VDKDVEIAADDETDQGGIDGEQCWRYHDRQ
jgi:hypothetical protein